jgi:glycosyltransferase involved in cell wall biosynthesis
MGKGQRSEVGGQRSEGWQLTVAGWDQAGYEAELKALTSDLGLPTSVSFVGPKFGEEKANAYRNADAFILPSLSEGLPMVVLEAWAYGKPVLMTPECNLPEGFAANAALQIGTTPKTIAIGLNQLMEMSDEERATMGARGRALVQEKFSWPRIGEQMRAVYEWVLGGGTAPETVRMD